MVSQVLGKFLSVGLGDATVTTLAIGLVRLGKMIDPRHPKAATTDPRQPNASAIPMLILGHVPKVARAKIPSKKKRKV
jgi:hypothetical protein